MLRIDGKIELVLIVDGLQCFSCDKNDIFTGADSCGDTAVTTSQNSKLCSEKEEFCVRVRVTKEGSTQQSQKMGCAGEVEALFALAGIPAHGFCKNTGDGCRTLPDIAASGFLPTLRNIKICCCNNNQ